MKLQIDTEKKTIKVEGDVKLVKLMEQLQKFLSDEWTEYTLETNSTIIWNTSTPYWLQPIGINNPYTITYGTNSGTLPLDYTTIGIYNSGTYNIEIDEK